MQLLCYENTTNIYLQVKGIKFVCNYRIQSSDYTGSLLLNSLAKIRMQV